jgi:hypothetical protein
MEKFQIKIKNNPIHIQTNTYQKLKRWSKIYKEFCKEIIINYSLPININIKESRVVPFSNK